jgi:hypothetical protein
MKTTAEVEAEVVRLHYAEHWRVGTIATQLALHPDVVKRVLGLGVAKTPSQLKARMIDPYREFIVRAARTTSFLAPPLDGSVRA